MAEPTRGRGGGRRGDFHSSGQTPRARAGATHALGLERPGDSAFVRVGRAMAGRKELSVSAARELAADLERRQIDGGIYRAPEIAAGQTRREFPGRAAVRAALDATGRRRWHCGRHALVGTRQRGAAQADSAVAARGICRDRKKPEQGRVRDLRRRAAGRGGFSHDGEQILSRTFFAGEVLDVDGITGGFNFQNAWTTGFLAGNAMADFKTISSS